MKALDNRFVTQDEQGNDMLIHYSHDWSIDYIGKMVKTPAVVDDEGNVTTPAELWDGERANISIHDSLEEWFLSVIPTGTMTNGTSFTEVLPVTPNRKFAGDDVEVDDTKVDKTETAFEVGVNYQVGKKVTFNGTTYRVGVGHKSQADWTPDIVPWFTRELNEGTPWSNYASHEFQSLPIGTAVTDEGTTYYLINQGQGHRKPSGQFGHFGWSETKPTT
jgi:hypothetical protein